MRFPYRRVGAEEFPLLAIGVHMPKAYDLLSMLVDSGATETLISRSALEEGGIDVDLNSPVRLTGFSSADPIIGYPCNVELSVRGHHFQSRVVAVDDDWLTTPILGHRDFFHHFRVTFEARHSTFSITPEQ